MTTTDRRTANRVDQDIEAAAATAAEALATLSRPAPVALVDQARADYATAMEADPSELSFLSVDWSTVMQRGGRGEVSFGYWRAKRQFRLEDLGIVADTPEQRQALDAVIDLPRAKLLVGRKDFDPIHEAATIESRGRTLLKAFSSRTGLGPFIPLGEVDARHPQAGWHYRAFKAAMTQVEQDFLAVRDRMAAEWDALISQTIGYWASVADKLYGDLLRSGKLPTRADIGLKDGNPLETPDQKEWVGWFLNSRVKPYMYTREEAVNSFSFSWTVQPIVPPQALLQAQAVATLDSAELELRRDMVAKGGDVVDSFFRDVVGDLRVRLLANCSQALKALQGNKGKLPARTQVGLRGFIEYVEAIQVWPDRQIEEQIAEMRAALDLSPNQRAAANDELQAMFRRIAAEAQLTLAELNRTEMRSTRELDIDLAEIGVPEDGPELERLAGRARRTLELDAPDDGPEELSQMRTRRRRSLD